MKVTSDGAQTPILTPGEQSVKPLDMKFDASGAGYALFARSDKSACGSTASLARFIPGSSAVRSAAAFPATACVRSMEVDSTGAVVIWVAEELWRFDEVGDHAVVAHSSEPVTGMWAMDSEGNTFEVRAPDHSDGGEGEIRRISPSGSVSTYGSLPLGSTAERIRVGMTGAVYVLTSGEEYAPTVDGEKSTVLRYDGQGDFRSFTLPYWRNPVSGEGYGQAPGAVDLVVDEEGAMYTANFALKSVSRISADGDIDAEFIHLQNRYPWSLLVTKDRKLVVTAVPDHDAEPGASSTIYELRAHQTS